MMGVINATIRKEGPVFREALYNNPSIDIYEPMSVIQHIAFPTTNAPTKDDMKNRQDKQIDQRKMKLEHPLSQLTGLCHEPLQSLLNQLSREFDLFIKAQRLAYIPKRKAQQEESNIPPGHS